MLLLITIVVVLVTFAFVKIFNKYDYWSKRGVPNPQPLPFLGNLKTLLFQQESPVDFCDKLYKEYKTDPYVGIYKIGQPALFLRDPELIKLVLIKDFDHFQYNDLFMKKTELFGQNPFLLNGDEWKVRRTQITPSLTPVKLKAMFGLMEQVANNLVAYIDKNTVGIATEGIQLSTKFMTDNYTSCIFGIDGRSFETNCQNSLFELGGIVEHGPTYGRFKKFCLYIKPGWGKFFRHNFFTKEIHSYHVNTVKEILDYRSKNNVIRNDFFDYIHKSLQKQGSRESVEELLAIHAATVYVDGVETAALTMGFVLHELAQHPEAQATLRMELQEMLTETDNAWNYEHLLGLEYLDSVISETLRLHPPLPFMNKICTKEFTFPKTALNSMELTIEVGTPIIVPIRDLHYDARYHLEPATFNPERFREGNRLNHSKNAYMPFGDGPRVCVGRKYAQMEIKVGVAKIVSKFEICPTEKTQGPLTYEKVFFLSPIGGLWIKLKTLPLFKI